jgi:hypothetical protein
MIVSNEYKRKQCNKIKLKIHPYFQREWIKSKKRKSERVAKIQKKKKKTLLDGQVDIRFFFSVGKREKTKEKKRKRRKEKRGKGRRRKFR